VAKKAMSDIVISVENLSKQYRLGQIGRRMLTETSTAGGRCSSGVYLRLSFSGVIQRTWPRQIEHGMMKSHG